MTRTRERTRRHDTGVASGPTRPRSLTILATLGTVFVGLHSAFLGWQTDGSDEALYETSLARLLGWAAGLALAALVVGRLVRFARPGPRPTLVAAVVTLVLLGSAEGWVRLKMSALRPTFTGQVPSESISHCSSASAFASCTARSSASSLPTAS